MGRTLSIELGIACNNNCLFCYQRNLRKVKGYPKRLPLEEIRRKLRWGIENGYRHAGFEGGEPTVRSDIVQIIDYARQLGYHRISITTNGRRLSDPDFARALVDAGLNAVGFSIHGPDPQTHIAHTQRKRSYEQALAGVRNIVALSKERRIDLNIFTVVTRKNADKLVDIALLFRGMGIRLFILQPIIYSKGNFIDFTDLVLPLDELVSAIRKVIYAGIKHDFQVKLFNLPPCLFSDILPGLEMDPLPPSVFREDEQLKAGEMQAGDEDGYVRLFACRDCVLRRVCPGLPLSLLPRFDRVQTMRKAIDYHQGPRAELWLTGMELLRGMDAFDVVRHAASSGYRSIKLLTGGTFVDPLSYEAAAKAGVDEVILVHRPRDHRSGDRLLHFQGNGPFLNDTLIQIHRQGTRVPVSLFSPPGKAMDEIISMFKDSALLKYVDAIRMSLTGRGFHLCSGQGFAFFMRIIKTVPRVYVELQGNEIVKYFPCLGLLSMVARGRAVFHKVADHVMRSGFSLPQYGVLNWSDPFPITLPRPPTALRITASSLRTSPISLQKLQEAALLRRLNRSGSLKLVE